jgi:hypothetical protein
VIFGFKNKNKNKKQKDFTIEQKVNLCDCDDYSDWQCKGSKVGLTS